MASGAGPGLSLSTQSSRNRMPKPPCTHPDILAALEAKFPGNVYLISRLADLSLQLSDQTAHIFIPDTHLVPENEIKKWPGRVLLTDRVDVLDQLLDALETLYAERDNLKIWQLGDLLDLWRTGGKAGVAFDKRMRLLEKSWDPLLKRFAKTGFPIKRLFGNHDEELSKHGYASQGFEPEDPGNTAGNDMLVTHGHQFDPIEDLPGWMKETFMRGGTERITPYARDFMSASNPQWAAQNQADYSFTPPAPPRQRSDYVCPDLTALDLVPLATDSWNVQEIKRVVRSDANPMNLATGAPTIQDERNPSLWQRGKVRAHDASNAGYSVALVVVGHTHNPRIIRGEQADGTPFVLMDCGGWIGPRFISPGINQMVHNCTVGVRVGSDLRIYQLTNDSYNWPKFR